jgi:alpha-glucosidase
VKLNIYYSNYEVNSFLFEDYGETFAYEQDIYLEKKFIVNGYGVKRGTNHTAKHGRFIYATVREGYFFSVVGLPFKPAKIMIDNKWVTNFTFNNNKLEFRHSKNFKQIKIMK